MAAPPERAGHAVETTATFEKKIAALRAHVSQTGHMDDLDSRLRGWSAATAQRHGLPEGSLAEAFQVVAIG